MTTIPWLLAGMSASASAWLTPGQPGILLTSATGTLFGIALAMLADIAPNFLYGALIAVPVVISFVALWGTLIALIVTPVLLACGTCGGASDEQSQSALGRMFGFLSCDLLGLWLYIRWISAHADPARRGELVQQTLLPFSYLYSFDRPPAFLLRSAYGVAGALMLLACLGPPIFWVIRRWWLDDPPMSANQFSEGSSAQMQLCTDAAEADYTP